MIVLKALNKICIEHYANLYKMRPTIPRLWHILYQGRKTRAPRRLRFPTLHTASVHGFGKPIDVSPILFDASRLNLLSKPPRGFSGGLTSHLQESIKGHQRSVATDQKPLQNTENATPDTSRETRKSLHPERRSGGGDDGLEREDSKRARKQIRMRKGFPSSPRRKKKGPRRESVETLNLEGMTGIEPA